MKYNTVAAMPDIRFSAIGFGCWSLGSGSGWLDSSDDESTATIHRALECGIRFFDTAPVYGFGGSERVLGKALRGRRDDIVLASKCGLLWGDDKVIRRCLAAESIRAEVDASLRRLQVDHLDLLQLHWPDHDTPLEETARALLDVLAAGKARYVGVTNFSLSDAERLAAMVPIASFQGLYNLLERNPQGYHAERLEYRTERDILPYCLNKGIAFIPYSPLFQGLLAGELSADNRFGADDVRSNNPKLNGSAFARYFGVTEALKSIAAREGLSLVELALGWLCSNPAVTTVICGAQHPRQIAANAAAGDIVLPAKLLEEIDALLARHGLPAE
ncbi:MAG: aldo/keto reductase [Ancalomicrobiaceae bacterium]|nr:aldo/keto reductase [Ancalomicrobiaceae bacterium]